MLSSTRIIANELKIWPAKLSSSNFLSDADLELVNPLMDRLVFDSNANNIPMYKGIHSCIIAKLTKILSKREELLSFDRPVINVISLACGILHEFFALKILLQQYNPNCTLNYIGIEINAKSNDKILAEYKNFPDFKLITGDASNKTLLKELLTKANCLPQNGFDLILLRHPEICSRELDYSFQRMIYDVIPSLSNEKSMVFLSAYQFIESSLITTYLKQDCYQKPKNDEGFIEGCLTLRNFDGILMEPENYFHFRYCKRPSLEMRSEAKENPTETMTQNHSVCPLYNSRG